MHLSTEASRHSLKPRKLESYGLFFQLIQQLLVIEYLFASNVKLSAIVYKNGTDYQHRSFWGEMFPFLSIDED